MMFKKAYYNANFSYFNAPNLLFVQNTITFAAL